MERPAVEEARALQVGDEWKGYCILEDKCRTWSFANLDRFIRERMDAVRRDTERLCGLRIDISCIAPSEVPEGYEPTGYICFVALGRAQPAAP